jgi:hypothetical protein
MNYLSIFNVQFEYLIWPLGHLPFVNLNLRIDGQIDGQIADHQMGHQILKLHFEN